MITYVSKARSLIIGPARFKDYMFRTDDAKLMQVIENSISYKSGAVWRTDGVDAPDPKKGTAGSSKVVMSVAASELIKENGLSPEIVAKRLGIPSDHKMTARDVNAYLRSF